MVQKRKPKKPGHKEERLKIKGDWQEAVKKALKKKRPPGWAEGKNQLR